MNIKNTKKGVALIIAAIVMVGSVEGTVSAGPRQTYSSSSQVSSETVLYSYLNADFFKKNFNTDYSNDNEKLEKLQFEVKKLLVSSNVNIDSYRSVTRFLLKNKSKVYAIIDGLEVKEPETNTDSVAATEPVTSSDSTTSTDSTNSDNATSNGDTPISTNPADTSATSDSSVSVISTNPTDTSASTNPVASTTATESSSVTGTVLTSDSFDSFGNWLKESDTSYGISTVKDPLNPSNNVARFELRDTDPYVYGGLRSEIASRWKSEAPGSEILYNWKVMLDPAHSNSSDWEIIAQFHAKPDSSKGETWSNTDEYVNGRPTIAIVYHNGYVFAELHNLKVGITSIISEKIPVNKGQWIDIKTNIKWSEGNDGFVELQVNGKPAAFVTQYDANWNSTKLPGGYRINMPTLLNPEGDSLKLGSYRNKKSVAGKSLLYYDDLKIIRTR